MRRISGSGGDRRRWEPRTDKQMKRRWWLKWRRLSAADRRLLAEASFRMGLAWILLRIAPFSWLARSLSPAKRAAVSLAEIRRIRWAVESVARHSPLPLMCLPQ